MHYYKRNLGDYAKKAGRLSMLQHGAYTLLLDACYDREKFPTRDQAIEWAWASNQDEIDAVDFVLGRFFKKQEDGTYLQERVAEELAEYALFCEQQAAKGKKGGRPKKPSGLNNKPSGLNKEPDGNPAETQSKPKKSLTTNHYPLTTNQDKNTSCDSDESAPAKSQCRFGEFWQAWPNTARKVAKAKCLEKWKARKLDKHADAIMAHIAALKATQTWRDGFEPAPLTYINQTRWEDGVPGEQVAEAAPWHQTRTGIIAKGQEIGLAPESFPDFQSFRTAVCRKEGIAA